VVTKSNVIVGEKKIISPCTCHLSHVPEKFLSQFHKDLCVTGDEVELFSVVRWEECQAGSQEMPGARQK
jgi:hypothetical protein